MKKFLAALFALAAIAGAGLFFGWAQRSVPPDSYGVLRSRSHGTRADPIVPGEFVWAWQRLIPTNAQVSAFRLAPIRASFSERGELPSGRLYAAFLGTHLGIPADFSWEISGSMSFRLRREALVPLVAEWNIGSQEELDLRLREIAEEVSGFAVRWIGQSAEFAREADALLGSVGAAPELAAEVERRFPDIEGFSLAASSLRLPDFALYEQARAAHGEFAALRGEHIARRLPALAADRLDFFTRHEELELQGELLTRFPILLEYLALEGRAQRE